MLAKRRKDLIDMLDQGHAQLGYEKITTPPAFLQEYLLGYAKSKVLFTAIRLRVFDALAGQAATADELAEILGFSAQAGERLLTACTTLGFLSWDGLRYRNTELATTYLLTGAAESIVPIALHADNVQYPLWQYMAEAVRENHTQNLRAFQRSGSLLGDDFMRNEQIARRFLRAMHWRSVTASRAELNELQLERSQHMLDIGGGTGAFCVEAVSRYPHLKATIMDLPHICPITRDYIDQAGMKEHIDVVPGDIFTSQLPTGADTIVTTLFLHDWPEEKQCFILKQIFAALPSQGTCIIAERFLPEDKQGDIRAALMNLNMLVATGGIEHTAREWRGLLESTGFINVRTISLSQSSRDLVIATAP